MKWLKWMMKCPLFILICAGWIALTAFTWSEGKLPDTLEQEVIANPVFTALLQPQVPDSVLDAGDLEDDMSEDEENKTEHLKDLANKESENQEHSNQGLANKKDAVDASAQVSGSDISGGNVKDGGRTLKEPDAGNPSETGDEGSKSGEKEEIGITRFKKYKKKKTNSQYYSDPGKKALTTEFPYQDVDKSYFDDAVFIGDSRTVGMQDYSGLENATFYAKTGMNVYEVLEDKFIEDPETGEDVSVAQMMKTHSYGKIYFMVGINELGTGNTGTFQKAYERVLKKFRKWQPNAVIYIQGIIPVSKVKASEDDIFNNININDKNVAIAQLADGKNIFYLDVSGKLTDKKGYLKADYTFDEVHMYAQYYGLWTEYLMKHAVI